MHEIPRTRRGGCRRGLQAQPVLVPGKGLTVEYNGVFLMDGSAARGMTAGASGIQFCLSHFADLAQAEVWTVRPSSRVCSTQPLRRRPRNGEFFPPLLIVASVRVHSRRRSIIATSAGAPTASLPAGKIGR